MRKFQIVLLTFVLGNSVSESVWYKHICVDMISVGFKKFAYGRHQSLCPVSSEVQDITKHSVTVYIYERNINS